MTGRCEKIILASLLDARKLTLNVHVSASASILNTSHLSSYSTNYLMESGHPESYAAIIQENVQS